MSKIDPAKIRMRHLIAFLPGPDGTPSLPAIITALTDLTGEDVGDMTPQEFGLLLGEMRAAAPEVAQQLGYMHFFKKPASD